MHLHLGQPCQPIRLQLSNTSHIQTSLFTCTASNAYVLKLTCLLQMCSTLHIFHCVIPENIHTSPMEGGFSNTSPTPWKFQLSFIHFYNLFGLIEPLTPQEIPILSVGGVWIFSESCTLPKIFWLFYGCPEEIGQC